MSQESDHERIRRLIQERMEQGKRPVGLPPIDLAASQGGLRLIAFALFRQAFVEAMVEQREREAGIPPGDPNVPVSWDGLEAVLGKAQVDRMKNGLSEGG